MSARQRPDKAVREVLDSATMDRDKALEAVRAVERGEAPSGSVIIALTGPRSLSSPGPDASAIDTRPCILAGEHILKQRHPRSECPVAGDEEDDGTTITILITHDENSLYATLHSSRDSAMEELRGYLNDNPVDYQDPLPEDASHEKIEYAANDRSQFSWEMLEQKVPGDVL